MIFLTLFLSLAIFGKTRGAVDEYTLQREISEEFPGPYLLFNNTLIAGTTLGFYFKTFVEDAIVVYQDDKGYSDYISVILENGRLKIS